MTSLLEKRNELRKWLEVRGLKLEIVEKSNERFSTSYIVIDGGEEGGNIALY